MAAVAPAIAPASHSRKKRRVWTLQLCSKDSPVSLHPLPQYSAPRSPAHTPGDVVLTVDGPKADMRHQPWLPPAGCISWHWPQCTFLEHRFGFAEGERLTPDFSEAREGRVAKHVSATHRLHGCPGPRACPGVPGSEGDRVRLPRGHRACGLFSTHRATDRAGQLRAR